MYRLALVSERITYAISDAVIATNESYRRIAIERGHKDPRTVHVVRNGPDLTRFSVIDPDPALKRGRPHLVCYVGIMGFQDGLDCAIRALAHLRHSLGRADVHAVFIGAGDALGESIALTRELELEDMVEFTGFLSEREIRRYLSTADVCLAPDPKTPSNDVSTMIKIMEYMAMRRPIVSFDLAETRVSAGDAAVYARADDEREFAGLIAELLDDPGRRERMGELGRARVESGLSWSVSARALVNAYQTLLDQHP